MMERYRGQEFFEYANEAAVKVREIYHIFGSCGDTDIPGEGTLLGDVYACIAEMVSLYLVLDTGKEFHSDELNDITTEIMFAEKDEIGSIVKKYCSTSV